MGRAKSLFLGLALATLGMSAAEEINAATDSIDAEINAAIRGSKRLVAYSQARLATTADEVLAVIDDAIRRHGRPRHFVSDQASQFIAEESVETFDVLRIRPRCRLEVSAATKNAAGVSSGGVNQDGKAESVTGSLPRGRP